MIPDQRQRLFCQRFARFDAVPGRRAGGMGQRDQIKILAKFIYMRNLPH